MIRRLLQPLIERLPERGAIAYLAGYVRADLAARLPDRHRRGGTVAASVADASPDQVRHRRCDPRARCQAAVARGCRRGRPARRGRCARAADALASAEDRQACGGANPGRPPRAALCAAIRCRAPGRQQRHAYAHRHRQRARRQDVRDAAVFDPAGRADRGVPARLSRPPEPAAADLRSGVRFKEPGCSAA